MARQFVNGVALHLQVAKNSGNLFKEPVFTLEQLIDPPNGGLAQADVWYLDEQPVDGDTVTLENDTDGSETYTFRTVATSVPFEVQIGADPDESMLNLATAIGLQSVYWNAKKFTNAETINDGSGSSTAGHVVGVWKQIPDAGDNDRIYGTFATPADALIVDFLGGVDYLVAVSISMPGADPGVATFGFGLTVPSLIPGERRAVLAEDQTWLWDGDAQEWALASGAGTQEVIRQYTGGVGLLDAVYQSGAGQVDQASANALATSRVIGFVSEIDEPDPGFCKVRWGGDLGGFLGLTPGATYILSKAAGQILEESDTVNVDYPDLAGEVKAKVGVANTGIELMVDRGEPKELS